MLKIIKPHCFWNLTLTLIRQLLRAPAANPFKCWVFFLKIQSSRCFTTSWSLFTSWGQSDLKRTYAIPTFLGLWEFSLKWDTWQSCQAKSLKLSASCISKLPFPPMELSTSRFSSLFRCILNLGSLYSTYNWFLICSQDLRNSGRERCLCAFIFHVSLCSDPNNTLHL